MTDSPLDRLDDVIAAVLRPARERVPAADYAEWARLLAALVAAEGRAAPDEAEQLRRRVGAALARRAAEPGGPDAWARAAGLVTALALLRATGLGCAGLKPYLGG